jgi:hypothetical protein
MSMNPTPDAKPDAKPEEKPVDFITAVWLKSTERLALRR